MNPPVFRIPSQVSRFLIIAALTLLVPLWTTQNTLAQNTLEPFLPVTGDILNGAEQAWIFSALDGAVVSFHLEATSPDLDPAFRISNSAGEVLIASDDYQYPDSKDALLEALTLPQTDTYTLTAFGVAGTSGSFRLTMTPGFSQLESAETFDDASLWKTSVSALDVQADAGQLILSLAGPDLSATAFNADIQTSDPYYAQVKVNVSGQGGWIVGMTARQQSDKSDYRLLINENGQWRFVLHQPSGDQILRDWTPHPAIVVGNTDFTLGMLVNGVGYDFFYNGQFFGRVDDATLTQPGGIGFAVETRSTLTSQTTARLDDLTITTPLKISGQTLIPSSLLSAKPADLAQELGRRGLIPAGGEMALTVQESFVESRLPGVQTLFLGRGVTFKDFAIGTAVSWTAASDAMTGCGLILSSSDDTHYTLAYLDQMGGYGLSRRDGDSFAPGIFGQLPALEAGEHHLLVVARANQLIYYVDKQVRGLLELTSADGAVGNAVVNFEPVSTSCQFANTWVWTWD